MHAFSKELYDTMGVQVFILSCYLKQKVIWTYQCMTSIKNLAMEKTILISTAGISKRKEYQYLLGEPIMRNTMGQRTWLGLRKDTKDPGLPWFWRRISMESLLYRIHRNHQWNLHETSEFGDNILAAGPSLMGSTYPLAHQQVPLIMACF